MNPVVLLLQRDFKPHISVPVKISLVGFAIVSSMSQTLLPLYYCYMIIYHMLLLNENPYVHYHYR